MSANSKMNLHPDSLAKAIKDWGRQLGFQQVGIANTDLSNAEARLLHWLDKGFHGDMDWMARYGEARSRPSQLVPGTLSVISVRMDYLPDTRFSAEEMLRNKELGYISCYALGRDYHKVLRKRLQRLATRIEERVGDFGYRAFVDSAPVMEKPLAQKAGLGWVGKHTNLINREAGSWFFLGELYTDLPLPEDKETGEHCGTCNQCIEACPTQAIVAPFELDARRCISYLTIEHKGAIPEELRTAMGNHIYGCDDCQVCCPWNRFSVPSRVVDFQPRHGLDAATLIELFNWDEATFLQKTEGSAIRRIGHLRWLRNIAVALGNSSASSDVIKALQEKSEHSSPLVREHVHWALARQHAKL